MRKTWVLDSETKGTGAQVVPLEKALRQPNREEDGAGRSRKTRTRSPDRDRGSSARARPHKPDRQVETSRTPLPPGHVRRTATGEIGRVRSVDAKAGTATVLWLRRGHTSTVPLSAITRR